MKISTESRQSLILEALKWFINNIETDGSEWFDTLRNETGILIDFDEKDHLHIQRSRIHLNHNVFMEEQPLNL